MTDLHELECALEAVLFAAGDSVSESKLCAVLQVDRAELQQAAQQLADGYDYERRGLRLLRLDDRYQLASRGDYAPLVRAVLETRKPPALSASALEVLAIVAYKQPVTRAYIEQIRGVDSAYSVSALLTKKLIREDGRLNVPGRPILYRTTPDFLRVFGLQSLDELPEIDKTQLLTRQQLQIEAEQAQNADTQQDAGTAPAGEDAQP